jgi:transposase
MWKDPIVEEVRKVRQEYAARFGDDLKAIYDDLKATERKGGRKIVSLPPKKLKSTEIPGIRQDGLSPA